MQWKTLKSTLGNTVFGLWSNGQKMLTLAYKNKPGTLYLETEDGTKRLFHYRKKGLFKKDLVIENEYGVDLGKLIKERQQEFIETDDKRFFLRYHNDHKEVEIIDEEDQESLATVQLEVDDPNEPSYYGMLMITSLYLGKAKTDAQLPSLSL
jgi:hypothetical protein